MRQPVLLKVPGVDQVRLAELMSFIKSDENRPLYRQQRSTKLQYVTLLDQTIMDGEKDKVDPRYNLSVRIVAEYDIAIAHGGVIGREIGVTPRAVMTHLLDLLGIFPPGLLPSAEAVE